MNFGQCKRPQGCNTVRSCAGSGCCEDAGGGESTPLMQRRPAQAWQPALKLRRIHPDAVLPTYGTEGAACFDFTAVDGPWNTTTEPDMTHPACELKGGNAYLFATGWEVEVPEGWVLLIYSRSGHGFRQGLRLSNCVGIIDSDYRGQLMVQLQADLRGTFATVSKGDRIAQGMLQRVEQARLVQVSELTTTARGAGGFGSTGR